MGGRKKTWNIICQSFITRVILNHAIPENSFGMVNFDEKVINLKA